MIISGKTQTCSHSWLRNSQPVPEALHGLHLKKIISGSRVYTVGQCVKLMLHELVSTPRNQLWLTSDRKLACVTRYLALEKRRRHKPAWKRTLPLVPSPKFRCGCSVSLFVNKSGVEWIDDNVANFVQLYGQNFVFYNGRLTVYSNMASICAC